MVIERSHHKEPRINVFVSNSTVTGRASLDGYGCIKRSGNFTASNQMLGAIVFL
jgi:hypothetical protein